MKLGWTDKLLKVVDKTTVMQHHYRGLKDIIPKHDWIDNPTNRQITAALKESWDVPVRQKDFEYRHIIDPKHKTLSMAEFYSFMLYERSGRLKKKILTPERELHEYNTSVNKKLQRNSSQNKERFRKVKTDEAIYRDKITIEKKKKSLGVSSFSRVQYLREDDSRIPFPRSVEGEETEYREKEKKNPIVYGGRLKLFYLCDQGIKMENNILRWHAKAESQKKYRRIKYKVAADMVDKGEAVDGHGKVVKVLPSSYTHGARYYSEKYYDGNTQNIFQLIIKTDTLYCLIKTPTFYRLIKTTV